MRAPSRVKQIEFLSSVDAVRLSGTEMVNTVQVFLFVRMINHTERSFSFELLMAGKMKWTINASFLSLGFIYVISRFRFGQKDYTSPKTDAFIRGSFFQDDLSEYKRRFVRLSTFSFNLHNFLTTRRWLHFIFYPSATPALNYYSQMKMVEPWCTHGRLTRKSKKETNVPAEAMRQETIYLLKCNIKVEKSHQKINNNNLYFFSFSLLLFLVFAPLCRAGPGCHCSVRTSRLTEKCSLFLPARLGMREGRWSTCTWRNALRHPSHL